MIVGLPPSASVADAAQVRDAEVVTPVDGVIKTEVTTGAVLSTVMLSVPVSVPPSASVAVAVHKIRSPGDPNEGVSARLFPKPSRVPEPLVQR